MMHLHLLLLFWFLIAEAWSLATRPSISGTFSVEPIIVPVANFTWSKCELKNKIQILSFVTVILHHTRTKSYSKLSRVSVKEARLAQLVERKALNLVVVGSSPTVGVLKFFTFFFLFTPLFLFFEWLNCFFTFFSSSFYATISLLWIIQRRITIIFNSLWNLILNL